MTSQLVQSFFAQLTTDSPYPLPSAAPSPSKLPLCMGDLDPYLLHGSLVTPGVHDQNGISISSAGFAGLMIVTDRQIVLLSL